MTQPHHHRTDTLPLTLLRSGATRRRLVGLSLVLLGAALWFTQGHASEPAKETAKSMGDQVRQALEGGALTQKKLTLVVNGKSVAVMPAGEKTAPQAEAHATPNVAASNTGSSSSRQYIRARAAALAGRPIARSESTHAPAPAPAPGPHSGPAHWSYAGATGPQAWATLSPDFGSCANGERQSPINIDEAFTLKGPAEPLQFSYRPSSGSVVNNGHTIQVDVYGDNYLTVRNTMYRLVQFHFHHPSEEQVNFRNFAMVVHLVHKDNAGNLAVVAVLLEPGTDNPLINKVWTHLPLDTHDRVRLPSDLIDLSELLPKDQRYYQFMGSLTTPPCTEGVLWMVLKQPALLSLTQLRLFAQLFPSNARPIQATNGRAVRDAQ